MEKQNPKRQWLFLQACAAGFDDIVQLMLNAGSININDTDEDGNSGLWLAIHEKHESTAQLLLQNGGINLQTMFRAIEEAYEQGVKALIQQMLDYPNTIRNSPKEQTDALRKSFNAINGFNFDILTAAIKMKNFSLAEKIVEAADIYIDMEADFTPLVSAIECNAVSLVEKLLTKSGLDINAHGVLELSPLLTAVKYPKIVELLLARKDTYARLKDAKGNTALILAIQKKAFETVKLLVKHGGVNVNAISKDAADFLTYHSRKQLTKHCVIAASNGVQTLLGHRICLNDYPLCGLTALQTAVALGYEEIALLLIDEANAKVDIPLPGNVPLLFLVIQQKQEKLAERLFQKYSFKVLNTAIPAPENPKHKITVLHMAFRMRSLNIFKMLLKMPIDVNRGNYSDEYNYIATDTVLGEIFHVHRHEENVYDYLAALLKRMDLNIHLCTEAPADNRTVFQIMTDEEPELLDCCPECIKRSQIGNGYDWHC